MREQTITRTGFTLPGQTNFQVGSVRDIYTIDDTYLAMVVTDRISAFDFVLPVTIPYKGQVLAQIARYFLEATEDIIPNWLISSPDPNVVLGYKCQPYKIEMVIRGYLCGHAWREYNAGKRIICGVTMPDGMKENDKFPEPIITPATHAESGHDEDISAAQIIARGIIPAADYKKIEKYTHALFARGTELAARQGLILADTKYEFGKKDGQLLLMDEIHTPDSSRYFYADDYIKSQKAHAPQRQLSKEFVREWLIAHDFQGLDGQTMPKIPHSFVKQVSDRYIELYEKLTGQTFVKPKSSQDMKSRIKAHIIEALEYQRSGKMLPRLEAFTLPKVKTQSTFDMIDPLDSRYYDSKAASYLSERSRISYQAYMEAALAHALADYGVCSQKIANEIETAAQKITAEEVYREEQKTKHDIKALVNCIKKRVSPSARAYVHFGATSYDIVASAQALQLRAASENFVRPHLLELLNSLIELTERYSQTTQIGRTHGQHALPITFGFAAAEYVERLGQSIEKLKSLEAQLTGKFSGAVGAYNAITVFVDDPIGFEKTVLRYVGLAPAAYSTQITPPETLVRLIDELVIAAGIMANLANDMRHLQRSEIAEIRERFEPGQTGSSTMAHKRNPWNFEHVASLFKQVLAQSINAQLNLSSEHQRDLTDSASSRFYVLAFATVAAMASRLNRTMAKIEVDEGAMQKNLKLSGGAIAAEPLYLLLAKYGHPSAHEKIKSLAHQALDSHTSLAQVIAKDKEADSYWKKFTTQEQQIIKKPELYYSGLAAQKAQAIAKKWKAKNEA